MRSATTIPRRLRRRGHDESHARPRKHRAELTPDLFDIPEGVPLDAFAKLGSLEKRRLIVRIICELVAMESDDRDDEERGRVELTPIFGGRRPF
ncbi:MAG: hypothetical protein KatS3mg008_0495 [Acidimicrobiales bacterium]|nr:MAG: hypothetical protein KatS3mg008_0495 [Acidimicrobiales bacterium]